MAKGGGGGRGPEPPRVPACPPELKCFFGCLVVLLRQMEARENAFAVEHARLLAEIDFLKREQSQRLEIARDRVQEIRRGTSLKDEMAELLEHKEPDPPRDPAFDELVDNYLESFRSWISTLADENTKLKKKLKEVEIQAELNTENTVDHQHSAKDSRADVRKLKQAYKTMVSEKDKEISVIRAEKGFAWNQFKSLEKELRDTCNRKSIEIKRANEAAEELEKTVHELRLEVQEKDVEILILQEEVVSAKENMLMIKNELEKMHSLVKSKDAETDQPSSSQKWKKDLKETKRKSKLEGPVSKEKSRIPHATPVKREVKTSRKCVSSAKGTHCQSGNNSRMHNTEERRQSETSQKRKRGSYSLSNSLRRCSTRVQVRPAASSPALFTPCFTIPKLTAPAPPPTGLSGQRC